MMLAGALAASEPLATPVAHANWRAALTLGYRRSADRCVLAERRHVGPLVVQKALYPEGSDICHTVLIHAPGGIAGGDELSIEVRLEAECHVLVTTPAAAKWYKSNGRQARQHSKIAVADDATLEWLPQETMLFNEADAAIESRIHLEGGAGYAGWDIVCLGRRASGETFRQGMWRQRVEIYRDAMQIWGEYGVLTAGDPMMLSPAGLNGCSIFGNFLVAAGPTPTDIVAACREFLPADNALHGVTATPDIFSARYLGDSAEAARGYFQTLWGVLRPWYAGQPARRPRLWDT